MTSVLQNIAHPRRWLRDVCGGESTYPLLVLFGLNAVDELDRTAFGILLPNIRDEYNLDNTAVLGLVAVRRAVPSPCKCHRAARRPFAPRAVGGRGRAAVGSSAA